MHRFVEQSKRFFYGACTNVRSETVKGDVECIFIFLTTQTTLTKCRHMFTIKK